MKDFLSRNSSFMGLMGVFGGISVYLSRFQPKTPWLDLGIVASLIIFILIAVTIVANIPPESSDQNWFDYLINQPWRKFPIVGFGVALVSLILSVVITTLQYSGTLNVLISLVSFIFGIGIVVKIETLPSKPEDEGNDLKIQDKQMLPWLLLLGGIGVAFSILGLLLIRFGTHVSYDYLSNLHLQSWVDGVLVGTFSGFVVGGALYGVVFGIFLFGHFVFRKFPPEQVQKDLRELGMDLQEPEPDGDSDEK